MEYPYIKNITHEKVQTLTSLVNAEDGQIVSKTLAQNEAVSVTLFAFAKGEEISTHDSTGDAMVTVLEGTGRFTVDGGFSCILHLSRHCAPPPALPDGSSTRSTRFRPRSAKDMYNSCPSCLYGSHSRQKFLSTQENASGRPM